MTMAIPGPFTRLLLIANRGWADLIEDVVLVSIKDISKLSLQSTYNHLFFHFSMQIRNED